MSMIFKPASLAALLVVMRVFKLREWALAAALVAACVLPASADPVLLVSNQTGQVVKFTLAGAPLGTFATVGSTTAGLAVRDQTVFVADYGNSLVRMYGADGTPTGTLSPGAGTGPVGMAVDADGNLFVSTQLGNTIRKFAPDGTDLGIFATTDLVSPWGLAFDASGDLYVALRGANQIRKYAPDGSSLGVFASTGMDNPVGIAFDSLGNLIVANFGNSTIRKFSPTGADLGLFTSTGVSQPTEIAFDDDGRLFVANWGSSTVRLYAADGTDLGDVVTSGLSGPQGLTILRDPKTRPDLQVSALKGKAVAGAGAPYTVTDTTKNAGEGAAPASETRFYLSVNATKDGGDIPLPPVEGRSVGVLAPGATSSGATRVAIPLDTPTSKRFVIACADGGDTIPESNEGNNCRSKTIYVGPDLVVSSVTALTSAPAGSSILVTDTTKNAGGAATTNVTTTRFYLSVDNKLGGSDIPLGPGRSVPVLAAGGSNTAGTMVTIPPGTTPGVYFIIAKADDGGVQTESKETNNVKARAITVN